MLLGLGPVVAQQISKNRGGDLSQIRNWGIQLQRANPVSLAASGCDLIVTDSAPNGQDLRSDDVAKMREPGQARPIRLAYISVGEAEDYRSYWNDDWFSRPPQWLGRENPKWKGNYAVRYWDPAWRRVLIGTEDSVVDNIIRAGFDGAFLDKTDAFEDWAHEHPEALTDMARLVGDIASAARQKKAGFLIVVQNGGQLLERADYTATIDGFVREDMLYGIAGDGVQNAPGEIAEAARQIELARDAGLPTFVIEYIRDKKDIASLRRVASELGFLPLVAERSLSTPPDCF